MGSSPFLVDMLHAVGIGDFFCLISMWIPLNAAYYDDFNFSPDKDDLSYNLICAEGVHNRNGLNKD